MNIISKYLEQLQIEQIAVDLISKAVSLILLFLFFLIIKRVADFIFKHAVEKSITLSRQNGNRCPRASHTERIHRTSHP